MEKEPIVSVILPNYCHSKYLDQRIDSILGQTFQNFELIILDDCSPDDGASKTVIEKYRKNEHVSHIVYNEVNSGSTFKQWHKGFELAKGEYIWIAESDDFCDKGLLERLMSEASKHTNASLLYVNSHYVDSEGVIIERIEKFITERQKLYDSREFDSVTFIRKFMTIGCGVPNASACIFKKEALKDMPLDYMDFKAAGDRLFWIHVAEKGSVVFVTKPMNYFRQHENKVSPRKMREGITHQEDLNICRYLCEKGYLNPLQKHVTWCCYIRSVYMTEFASNEIMHHILEMWREGCNHGYRYTNLVYKIKNRLDRMHIEIL